MNKLELSSTISVSGPDSPIALSYHAIVNFGTDLVVIGGYSCTLGKDSNLMYQLSAENGAFKWEKMKAKLEFPRSRFVAMTIPDYIVDDA